MDTTFADDVVKVMNKAWSYSNTFNVQLLFSPEMVKAINWSDEVLGRDLNLHIVSVNTPDFSNTPIETYIGGQYRIHNGKDELYRFSITFRDSNQMILYRKFLLAYRLQKDWYFDDAKSSIILTKEKDYYNETDLKIMEYGGVLIEGVSNLDINNDNDADISQFTVKFKATQIALPN